MIKSFKHAFSGIYHCIKYERNFRIHIIVCAYVLFFTRFYDFSRTDYALLFIVIAGVLVAEILNTSVERIVNLQIRTHHLLAKEAKDIAAGAVLCSSAAAVAVGICLFGKRDNLMEIVHAIKNPSNAVILIATVILSVIFIKGKKKIKEKRES